MFNLLKILKPFKKMSNKFKKGDTVMVIAGDNVIHYGKVGKVCVTDYYEAIGVEFPFRFLGGHSCRDACDDGRGRYFPARALRLISRTEEIEETEELGRMPLVGENIILRSFPSGTDISDLEYYGIKIGDMAEVKDIYNDGRCFAIFKGKEEWEFPLRREQYSFPKEESNFNKIINQKKYKNWLKTMEEIAKAAAKKQIVINVERTKGQTFISFEFAPEIEEIWKMHDAQIKESTAWEGLKFYYIPEVIQSREYVRLLDRYGLRDDYGHSIFGDDGKFNIAFIRTVGGKGKIKVKNTISHSEIIQGVDNTGNFIKDYFQAYLKDFKFTCNININI